LSAISSIPLDDYYEEEDDLLSNLLLPFDLISPVFSEPSNADIIFIWTFLLYSIF
jgi:hypothetical protein